MILAILAVLAAGMPASALAQTRPAEATAHAIDELANCRAQHRPDCPTDTPTPTITPVLTGTPVPKPTDIPTEVPTDTPAPSTPCWLTDSNTGEVVFDDMGAPVPCPSATAQAEQSPTSTEMPTAMPTTLPTDTPTLVPTPQIIYVQQPAPPPQVIYVQVPADTPEPTDTPTPTVVPTATARPAGDYPLSSDALTQPRLFTPTPTVVLPWWLANATATAASTAVPTDEHSATVDDDPPVEPTKPADPPVPTGPSGLVIAFIAIGSGFEWMVESLWQLAAVLTPMLALGVSTSLAVGTPVLTVFAVLDQIKEPAWPS